MPKKTPQKVTLYDKPWKHVAAAVVGFILAYGTASLALDNGSLLVYGLTIVLLVLSINHVIGAIKQVYAR